MTTPHKLLVALLNSAASTGALSEIARIPELAAKAMLQRLQKEGHLSQRPCEGVPSIIIWSLTETGREAAMNLNTSAV
jgi:DNA-binding MarR family transcriptional regulator